MSVGEILERDENRPAYVRFERRAVTDSERTLSEGHHVSKDEDYALITPPYSKDVVEKKVAAWFVSVEKNVRAGRIPQKHLDLWKESYRRWQDGQEPPVDGTPIKDWSSVSPAQCKNLLNAGCRSVEDLAQANDEAMRRLGMGAHDLKNKARAWLQAAKDHGPLTMQIASLEKENDQLKGTIQSLQDQIKRFEIRMDAQDGESNNQQHSDHPYPSSMESTTLTGGLEKTPAERYEEKFGKKPHHLMKPETILKKLQE
jgi:FtsZ-binding cell division protein ZapB